MNEQKHPKLVKILNGWMAGGDGWAVTGDTEENALTAYRAAELKHAEIMAREDTKFQSHTLLEE